MRYATHAIMLCMLMWYANLASALWSPYRHQSSSEQSLNERAAGLRFLTPKHGDVITATKSGRLNITWTTTSATDVPLTLSLLQGSPGNLVEVLLIRGTSKLFSQGGCSEVI